MRNLLLSLILGFLTLTNVAIGQELLPINDLPGATLTSAVTELTPPTSKDYTPTNCDDLSQNISFILGVASTDPGSPERVGVQLGRIWRDGVPSVCPTKAYPGIFNAGTSYGYHAIQFSNVSANPVCITVTAFVDGGTSPCAANAHGIVYQSADGLNQTPYDPANQGANFLGDIGSSVSQPFNVTVNPGYFEIVFTNTFSVSQCEVAFNITVDPGDAGAIQCDPYPAAVPMSSWPLVMVVLAIVIFTVFRYRRKLV